MTPLRLITIGAVFSTVLACLVLTSSPASVQGYHNGVIIEPTAPTEEDFVRIRVDVVYVFGDSTGCYGSDYPVSDSYSIAGQTITIEVVYEHSPGTGANWCHADWNEWEDTWLIDIGPLAAGDYTVVWANCDGCVAATFTVTPAPSPDADVDGFSDVAESGMPLCAQNNDDDSDGVANDGCPGGPAQAGSFSEAQFNIGTNPLGGCGAGVEAGPSASWPLDFVSGGYPDSTDKVTITDLTSFLAPVRRLDTSSGEPNFSSRWDLVPGNGMIFPGMINVTDLTAMFAGSTGSPPMLGGARALNGPSCTGA